MNSPSISFVFLYALTYMCNAVYGTFVPVYFQHIGFNQMEIGTLLTLGPAVAMLGQPVWGTIGDRSKIINSVLQILLAGSAITILFYPVSGNFYYLLFMVSLFTFFQTSINPISDAIALDYLARNQRQFGPVRMAGTIGYALMAVVTGMIIVAHSLTIIFRLYFFVAICAFLVTFWLPKIKGQQTRDSKIQIWVLFKDRKLVLFSALNLVIQITLGFYYTFFPIYFKNIGADNSLLGFAMFISAMSEIPFLLFADRIVSRLGIPLLLLISAFITAIRWFLLSIVSSPYWGLPIQFLHGFIFIVFSYCMATYINKEAPKELKATGQTINGIIGTGISRVIGGILGGVISDWMGIRQVFFYNSLIAMLATIIFGAIFFLNGVKQQTTLDWEQN